MYRDLTKKGVLRNLRKDEGMAKNESDVIIFSLKMIKNKMQMKMRWPR